MRIVITSVGLLLTAFMFSEDELTVQLPPIPTAVAIEVVELPELSKWQADVEVLAETVEHYLLPIPGSDLVISTSISPPPLPKVVRTSNQKQDKK